MHINRRSMLRAGASAVALTAMGLAAPRPAFASPDWEALRARLQGRLVLPSDAAYEQSRHVYFAQFDTVLPQGVAYCAAAEDVRSCIRFAQDNGVPAVVRSGGHSHAGFSVSDGLVIDVSGLNSISVGTDSTVTVGPGVQQVDATSTLAGHGLGLPGGLCPTVGVAGFVLGGGLGPLTREHGMGCDHLVSAEVVLANGDVVRCSEDSEPDLYWALRGGGGGNFGVVTSFQLRPVQTSTMVNFKLTWPWADASAVFGAWQDWLAATPNQTTPVLGISLPDAAPGAAPVVTVSGGWTGAPEAAGPILDDLVARVGSAPQTRSAETFSYADAMLEWYGCSDKTVEECHWNAATLDAVLPRGNYLVQRNRMFSRNIPANGIDELLAAFDAGRLAGHTRALNATALGGQANAPGRTDTAYVHRDTLFEVIVIDTMGVSMPDEDARRAAEEWTAGVFAVADRYSNGESYQNMPDSRLSGWRESYYAENYQRLADVKQAYDPARFFDFPQAVG